MNIGLISVSSQLITRLGDAGNDRHAAGIARAQANAEKQVWAYFLEDDRDPTEIGVWRLWSIELDDWSPQDVHKGPFASFASLFNW